MSHVSLSLEQSPPLSVPGPYFAAAPLFAVAAGLWLLFQPSLFQSRWLPGTLALTHLVTLGVLAMVMTGAFQQLLPVLAGAPVVRALQTARVIFAGLLTGTVALAAGLATGRSLFLWLAIGALGAGLALFLALAALSLLRSPSRHPSVRDMGLALAGFAGAAALGLFLAAGHGGAGVVARQFTEMHVVWGALGWIALLVMGVAYQVVPMFQVTPDYPAVLTRTLAPGLLASLLLFTLFALQWPEHLRWAGVLPAAALVAFALTTLALQQGRRRRLPDVTVSFWRLGMVSLLLAVACWSLFAAAGRQAPALVLGVLFLAGFAMSVVSGMLYKIVPFLVWLHLNNLKFTTGARLEVPTMKQVIGESRARLHFLFHLLALCFLLMAAFHPAELLVRLAGVVFAVSAALLAINIWSAFGVYVRVRRGAAAPGGTVGA